MKNIIALILLLLACAGCDVVPQEYRVRQLPARTAEVPGANIPKALRIHNWEGSQGEGSCVHATTKNSLVWLCDFENAKNWNYENGETANGLLSKLDKKGIPHISTQNGNHRYLEWASDLRLPAIIWWKPSHCCMFAGFVSGKALLEYYPSTVDSSGNRIDPESEYAAILDNNRIAAFEYTEKSRFIRLWHGYGGFAAIILKDPTTSMPYESYQLY